MLYTVGHSTRPLAEFIGMLRAHGVEFLADIRSIPRSRRNPQFNRDTLPEALQAAGIGYTHVKALGGLRKARADSGNTAWRNPSFRGYADYMLTDEFRASLRSLIDLARGRRVAMMCAEAVPWRCHRSLVADALLADGHAVEHILSASRREPHTLTEFAIVRDGQVTYPAGPGQLLLVDT